MEINIRVEIHSFKLNVFNIMEGEGMFHVGAEKPQVAWFENMIMEFYPNCGTL